ncbi:MAG: fused MFS/spermidine synthase [Gemmataceae bacterium]|nr:fused MFS/spermidine synthase [Gemmataceae bacterium]
MPLLFAVTLFLSAGLLFMVQPMVGKMILPLLGGSPAVWNACMVFFQALLLLGYLYAHFVSTRLHPRRQWVVHLLVLLGPVAAMGLAVAVGGKHVPIPIADALAPTGEGNPILSVMALLTVAIGVPFFVSSTSAPLLQKWFGYTGHPSARDPYFLYAASNAGSLLSLLGYPLFVEPNMILNHQAWLWAAGFVALIFLILACGRAAADPVGVPPEGENLPRPGKPAAAVPVAEPPPSTLRILRWVALAFVPSSLMLGVTFYMTTDIASVPLLWAVPLALYLVTFIIAFSTIVPPWFRLVVGNFAPVMILLLVFVTLSSVTSGKVGLTLSLHMATFFAVALMCHYELALDRPSPAHLTGYFLWISVGGVLGGIFNALVAPLVFAGPYEYKLTLVMACFLVPRLAGAAAPQTDLERYKARMGRYLDFGIPLLVAGVFYVLVTWVRTLDTYWDVIKFLTENVAVTVGGQRKGVGADVWDAILRYALPVMACFFFVDRPVRFGLCVAALLAIHEFKVADRDPDTRTVHTERTFFGILKINDRRDSTYPARSLVHGTTLHGTQFVGNRINLFDVLMSVGATSPLEAALLEGSVVAFDPKQEPLTYYHRTGPVGAMFYHLRTRDGGARAKDDVAMVGLGTGSASAYALPGQRLTFYEIDPAVKRLVGEDSPYFSYVTDALNRGAKVDFRMGDARLKLAEDEDRKYGLLMVDAFSSDSIPVHLLTREAVELYMQRLAPGGVLALHISNKYIRLEPVAAKIAHELGLAARVWNDNNEGRPGKTASSWVVLARDAKDLGVLAAPAVEQAKLFGTKNQALSELLALYPPETPAADALAGAWGGAFAGMRQVDDKQAALFQELKDKKLSEAAAADRTEKLGKEREEAEKAFRRAHGREALALAKEVQRADAKLTLGELTDRAYGEMFHPLDLVDDVGLWTDDYSDVLRVIMIDEVQWVRKKLGLKAPFAK